MREKLQRVMQSRFTGFLREEAYLLVYSTMGISTLLLLSSGLPARYPYPGGDSSRALWIVLACAVLMILWRALSGPRKVVKSEEDFVILGANRRELIREVVVSLVLQVVLPLTLLAAVAHQRVFVLFTPHRGILEAAVVTSVCAIVIVLLPPKVKKEQSRMSLLRVAIRAFPYLLVRAGLTEEVLFRGCIQTAAMHELGALSGIALAAAIFSVGHVYQVFWLKRTGAIERIPWGAVAFSLLLKQMPCTLLFSLLWYSTGNLWVCVLLHGWIDAWYLGPKYAQAVKYRKSPCKSVAG